MSPNSIFFLQKHHFLVVGKSREPTKPRVTAILRKGFIPDKPDQKASCGTAQIGKAERTGLGTDGKLIMGNA